MKGVAVLNKKKGGGRVGEKQHNEKEAHTHMEKKGPKTKPVANAL